MADNTLAQNVAQAISDFDDIKDAIESANVAVASGTPTSSYADKVIDVRDKWEYLMTNGYSDYSNLFYLCNQMTAFPKLRHTSRAQKFNHLFDGCKQLTSVDLFDTSNATEFQGTFENCTSLRTVPLFDWSSMTKLYMTFNNCSSLTAIPQFDTSKVTTFYQAFYQCSNLINVPALDTSSGTNFEQMFSGCSKLQTIERINLSNNEWSLGSTFYCSALRNITFEGTIKSPANKTFVLHYSPLLTVESLMSCINHLYDYSSQESRTLSLGTTNLDKLTNEQKAIATAKGWTLK